ncbi:histone H1-like repetitive region-containing protein, partial [Chlamydia pneumoniae]
AKGSPKKAAACALACHKNHKHTSSCKRVCSSTATRKHGSKSRVRTAHGWRHQLIKMMSR